VRARLKGQNGLLWAIITGCAFLAAYFIGIIFIVMFALKNKININPDSSKQQYQDAAKQLTQEFINNPLLLFTVYFFGIGGYLLIRFIIDHKHDKNAKEIHWMDKLNNDSQVNNDGQKK
jgi:predicted Co/Zn/Cd cation transporter (cation efflux family)